MSPENPPRNPGEPEQVPGKPDAHEDEALFDDAAEKDAIEGEFHDVEEGKEEEVPGAADPETAREAAAALAEKHGNALVKSEGAPTNGAEQEEGEPGPDIIDADFTVVNDGRKGKKKSAVSPAKHHGGGHHRGPLGWLSFFVFNVFFQKIVPYWFKEMFKKEDGGGHKKSSRSGGHATAHGGAHH